MDTLLSPERRPLRLLNPSLISGWKNLAAQSQSEQLPFATQELIDVLTSVNYQLGTQWFKKFPKTWSLLKSGKYEEAAVEVESSLWHKQTPVRVRDFQRVLWRTALLQQLSSV